MRVWRWLGAMAIAWVAAPPPAAAYFEDVAVDSRAVAMGHTLFANSTDVGAYYWNPAGLAELRQAELLLDYGRPYLVSDLSTNAAAFAWPMLGIKTAVGWHRLGIRDVYAEDLFSITAARALPVLVDRHAVSGGATLKLGRVSLQPYPDPNTGAQVDFGSATAVSLDLGVRWVTPWKIDLAWVGRDLLTPRYELIDGTGGGEVSARQQFGLAYRWNTESTLTAGWSDLGIPDHSSLSMGLEIWFYDVFAIRSGFTHVLTIPDATQLLGLSSFNYTGGIGVRHRGWQIDAAALTDPVLGASYRASLKVRVPGLGG